MKNVCPGAPRAWPDCPGQRQHTLTIHYLASCEFALVSSSPGTWLSWGHKQGQEGSYRFSGEAWPKASAVCIYPTCPCPLLMDCKLSLRVCSGKPGHHKYPCIYALMLIYLKDKFPEVELLCQKIRTISKLGTPFCMYVIFLGRKFIALIKLLNHWLRKITQVNMWKLASMIQKWGIARVTENLSSNLGHYSWLCPDNPQKPGLFQVTWEDGSPVPPGSFSFISGITCLLHCGGLNDLLLFIFHSISCVLFVLPNKMLSLVG